MRRGPNEWNEIARRYAAVSGQDGGPIFQLFADRFWSSLGDVGDLDVLDLGCGHGWLSQHLHQAGARVCGVDGSRALLERARLACPEVEFFECDLSIEGELERALGDSKRRFDRAVAHMVLMDLPDVAHLLRSLRTQLRESARFLFTLPHPCFFNFKTGRDDPTGRPFRKITGYLDPEVWQIETFGGHSHYHRSLTYYFDHLREAGFAVTQLYEPPHTWAADAADAEFRKSIPVFVLIEAVPIRT